MGKKTEIMIGGQAVIEGVMMRTRDDFSVAVRSGSKKIVIKKEKFVSATKKHRLLALPLVRGMVMLYETMVLGIKALNFSASVDMTPKERKEELGKGFWITMAVSTIFALAIFKFLPLVIASLAQDYLGGSNLLFNAVDGISKFLILIGYLSLISLMPDVRRLFEYHGAEHMAVACYEKGKKLVPANVMKCRKEHSRCGTSFIMFVLVLSIIFYMFIPFSASFWQKLGLRLLFLPIIAGVSYELIRLAGKHDNWLMRAVVSPGILVQKITTRKPDKSQVEVAIKSLEAVLR